MIQTILWILSILLVSTVAYLLSYLRFRRVIAQQTKQMISLMKAENVDNMQVGDIYSKVDEDFSHLERAALGLRKKYLRLKRQSLEERQGYEIVFSGLKEGIITVDQNLKIISFNDSFMSFFNWAPIKEQNHFFLHDVIRDPQIISAFKRTFETTQTQKSEVDSFHLFVTPLPSLIENESWCLGVFYDLSEIRKTEKIRIDFVANASHEMRTPLTVIKGYSELLKQKLETLGEKDGVSLLEPILQSTDHMSELMTELLNLSKVDTATSLVKSQLSTREVTELVLAEVENIRKLALKTITVEVQVEVVFANLEAIKQVLRNLLVNAIKYSGDANEIKVSWVATSYSTLLCVKDGGPGIPKEHQDRIFERFYRIDKGRNRDQGGFGLGLALVKHYVINHGGHIKLISEPNSGSEFICEFPNI